MKLSFEKKSVKQIDADFIATFVHQDTKLFQRETKQLAQKLGARISAAEMGDFKGKGGEATLLYVQRGASARRILLVGLGEKKNLTLEKYRRAAATAAKRSRTLKAKRIALSLPSIEKQVADAIAAFAEGACLSLYKFDKYITKKQDEEIAVEEIVLCSEQNAVAQAAKTAIPHAQVIAEATYFARDLANAPGNEIYPESLADAARQSAERCKYKAAILDEVEIKELGMGGIIGVCEGSARKPRFIILEYGKAS
ncbi:MAG: hypothetical protein HY089_08020, partial [Ignavibacteriales bacterium]|nr:hypothetical protein [Ignavibacteriales bacterium]